MTGLGRFVAQAAMTGLFCMGFTLMVDWATDMLERGTLVGLSFISGALGSVVSQLILGARGSNQKE